MSLGAAAALGAEALALAGAGAGGSRDCRRCSTYASSVEASRLREAQFSEIIIV
jgi:hypothetical protein